ncbi:hypothetical protein D3248_12755 [Leucobacter zeae]|nr:hypothetical protein [Leucobacter zeae]
MLIEHHAIEPALSQRSPRFVRALALLIGVALLCLGLVFTGTQPAHAAGYTVSGTLSFPASTPSALKQPVKYTDSDSQGIYLTLYEAKSGTVTGWELGTDANVTFDPNTGAWAVKNVPNGKYRLTISLHLPKNGTAPGTNKEITVNNANVAAGKTAFTESGRLRASFAVCGWKSTDSVSHYVRNTATGAVTKLQPAQSGWVQPSTQCPPEVGYGNYDLPAAGIPAGNYTAYTVWNGVTQYYTGKDKPTSWSASKAQVFPVKVWEGNWIQTLYEKVTPYADVPKGHTFFAPVAWMYENGYAAKAVNFYPANTMTRGAMATMLQRINDSDYQPSASLKLPYSDVQKTDTHYKGIAWMYENGYAAKASKYHAGNAVTRGAMATFMQRMKAPTYQPSGNLPYTDVKKTDTHYKGIAWMTENGYVAPASKYRADAPLTRGAMSAFLNRIFA